MKFSRRTVTILVTLTTLVVLILIGLTLSASRESRADQPAYQFATLQRGTLERTVSSTGTLAAVETVEVGSQISGTIKELRVDYNSKVKKGQVLAIIDQSLYQASEQEAGAGVNKAQANLTQAEDDYQRNLPLFEKGFLSAQEFAPTRTAVETARAGLIASQASLTRARTSLTYTVIRSPIDGTVIKRSVEAGQTVAASLSTPTLFLIARDLGQMQIEVNVDESDIGQIRQGQPVRFTVQAYPDQSFSGVVNQIRLQPTTISSVVNYTVLVKASNKDLLLLPGMTATVDFVVAHIENALLAPNAALRFQPPGDAPQPPKEAVVTASDAGRLYRVAPSGELQRVPVVKGESDGINTVISGDQVQAGLEVVSGLKPQAKEVKQNFFSFLRPSRPGGGGR